MRSPKKNHSISQIYSQIEDELRNQYSLAYRSDRVDGSTGYRKISLTTPDRKLALFTLAPDTIPSKTPELVGEKLERFHEGNAGA